MVRKVPKLRVFQKLLGRSCFVPQLRSQVLADLESHHWEAVDLPQKRHVEFLHLGEGSGGLCQLAFHQKYHFRFAD